MIFLFLLEELLLLLLLLIPLRARSSGAYSAPLERCPYAVLGISRDATLAEVRAAYRQRARETHPDKRKASDTMTFLEVVAAFELLSDSEERRRYDRTGETTSRHYRDQQQRWRARLSPEHVRAMKRVVVVKSRKHLEDSATDNGILDRHLLLALYDPGACEDRLTYGTLFPYPFADKVDAHGIWWEDVLQTAKARMTEDDGSPSRIARRFGLDDTSFFRCPSIVFARNGSSLWDDFEVLRSAPDARAFEAWVWPKLQARVHFQNDHTHTIRIFWIRGTQSFDPFELEPGARESRAAYVSHLFAARDVRAGGPLTPESVLLWQHVDADPFVYRVESKCVDWHGSCPEWAARGECAGNPDFMLKFCAVSCAKPHADQAARLAAEAARRALDAREAARAAREAARDALRRARAAEALAAGLESDAVAAEIVAEAQQLAVSSCSPAYPEKHVRSW